MESKELKIEEIKKIIESGDFDQFINVRENDYFEAKSANTYNLESKISLARLAQDIASIANKEGGYIILGLKAPNSELALYDVVTELDLTPKELFYNIEKFVKITQEIVYPKLEDVDVNWYKYKKDELGLGVIFISKQNEERKYFIATICAEYAEAEEEKKLKNYICVPIRQDAGTIYLKNSEIYKLMKRKPTDIQNAYELLSSQIEELKGYIKYKNKKEENYKDNLQDKIDNVINNL